MKGKIWLIFFAVTAGAIWPILASSKLLGFFPGKYIYKVWKPKAKIYQTLSQPEIEAINHLSGKIKGYLLWASNREGNHNIFLLNLRQKSLKKLTNHPHQDIFPKFSPNGNWVSFLRSQKPWVSFREIGAWDIYIINLKTGKERFIATGEHPGWTSDSRNLIFKRNNQIYKINIFTKEQELIFDGDKPPVNGPCGEPSLSIDGTKLALGIRTPQFKGIGIVNLKSNELKKIYRHSGCHLAFAPDNTYIYWIGAGGKGKSQVFYSPVEKSRPEVFIDLPSEYSHEYFPRISNDGKWLIWGASAKGHEHDIADYEIFLWEIGSPWNNFIRFTYSAANDQWPDLFVNSTQTQRKNELP